MKCKAQTWLLFVVGWLFLAGSALGADLIVYPAKNQSKDQMEKDKYDCYTWAKGQSKFDPMQTPTATAPPPEQQAPKGGVGRGAARGAAVGAAVGSLDGEMGEGAKKGAVAGAMVGGMRRRHQRREEAQAEQQWAEKQATEYTGKRSEYDRAYGACLEGKGYTVK